MDSTRIPYKQDAYGKDLFARVTWSKAGVQTPKPIVLILHAGGLLVGSSEIIPKPQVEALCNDNFICVIPNYRLAPQVTAKTAYQDCEDAFDWAVAALPETMSTAHGVQIDTTKVVAMGHSSGGTLALHIASCRPVKAVTAFYPSLFLADPTTSAHHPSSAPPFGQMPDFTPTAEDWAEIRPSTHQISEVALTAPGTVPPPGNKWQMHILKHGEWLSTLQPDGDFASIDPMTRANATWPPVMIVHGAQDNVPGSDFALAERAVRELREKGLKQVRLEVVEGGTHMFDLPPMVGTTDLGAKWKAVVQGLGWLKRHL